MTDLANYRVAEIKKGLGGQLHNLLGAGGDYYVVKIPADIKFVFHIFRNGGTQRIISFGDRILKRKNGVIFKKFVGNFSDLLTGKGLGSGIARRKGDELRSAVALRISLIADGWRLLTLLEN